MRESTQILENLGESILTCVSCKKELVNIVKVRESSVVSKYIANCPCGGRSFTYEVNGDIYLAPVPGKVIIDVDSDNNSHTVRLINV